MDFLVKFFKVKKHASQFDDVENKLNISPWRAFHVCDTDLTLLVCRDCERRGRVLLFDSSAPGCDVPGTQSSRHGALPHKLYTRRKDIGHLADLAMGSVPLASVYPSSRMHILPSDTDADLPCADNKKEILFSREFFVKRKCYTPYRSDMRYNSSTAYSSSFSPNTAECSRRLSQACARPLSDDCDSGIVGSFTHDITVSRVEPYVSTSCNHPEVGIESRQADTSLTPQSMTSPISHRVTSLTPHCVTSLTPHHMTSLTSHRVTSLSSSRCVRLCVLFIVSVSAARAHELVQVYSTQLRDVLSHLQLHITRLLLQRSRPFVTHMRRVYARVCRYVICMFSTPRLLTPVWPALQFLARTRDDQFREEVCHRFTARFVCLLERLDTKQSYYFMSRLLTAVFIYHSEWVGSLQSVGVVRNSAHISPRQSHRIRTVIRGDQSSLVDDLLFVLSYFIRFHPVSDMDAEYTMDENDLYQPNSDTHQLSGSSIHRISHSDSSSDVTVCFTSDKTDVSHKVYAQHDMSDVCSNISHAQRSLKQYCSLRFKQTSTSEKIMQRSRHLSDNSSVNKVSLQNVKSCALTSSASVSVFSGHSPNTTQSVQSPNNSSRKVVPEVCCMSVWSQFVLATSSVLVSSVLSGFTASYQNLCTCINEELEAVSLTGDKLLYVVVDTTARTVTSLRLVSDSLCDSAATHPPLAQPASLHGKVTESTVVMSALVSRLVTSVLAASASRTLSPALLLYLIDTHLCEWVLCARALSRHLVCEAATVSASRIDTRHIAQMFQIDESDVPLLLSIGSELDPRITEIFASFTF